MKKLRHTKDKVPRKATQAGDTPSAPAVPVRRAAASAPAPAAGSDTTKKTFLGSLEGWLNFATAAVVLVAAIGLPAVAIQLIRFGVPIGTASYHDVLRAGALPAVVMAIVTAYCVTAGRASTRLDRRQFLAAHTLLLLPALIPAYIALIVGLFAYVVLFGWLLLWVIRALMHRLGVGLEITNRELLLAAAAITTIILLLWWIATYLERRWPNWKKRLAIVFWKAFKMAFGRAFRKWYRKSFIKPFRLPRTETQSAGAERSDQGPGVSAKSQRSGGPSLVVWASLLPFFLLMLYCIKWIVTIWDPRVGHAIPHRVLLFTAIGAVIVLALFLAGILTSASTSSGPKVGAQGRRIVILVGIAVYLMFEAVYSMWGYPRLYAGLGGGRPQVATLWLQADDSASDIVSVLRGTVLTRSGSLSRVDSVFVLFDNDETLLLTDAWLPPARALLVNRSRLLGLSWQK